MYFGHKNVETGPNFSHKLTTFLMYYMALSVKKRMIIKIEKVRIFIRQ